MSTIEKHFTEPSVGDLAANMPSCENTKEQHQQQAVPTLNVPKAESNWREEIQESELDLEGIEEKNEAQKQMKKAEREKEEERKKKRRRGGRGRINPRVKRDEKR